MDKFVTRHRKRSAVETDEWKTEEPLKKYKEECEVEEEFSQPIPWQKIEAEGLDCDYSLLFDKEEADYFFNQLEEEVEYFTGDKAKLQVYGKTYSIPRKQATYGDEGLMYSFSGVQLLAKPWTSTLEHIRDAVTKATGHMFNFVLINR
ncbi:DNA oxidative demethylase ALKBH2 [Labeo rohita]|nr:DNA oxidative demethylase ALKBH2 [Labeo rohita]